MHFGLGHLVRKTVVGGVAFLLSSMVSCSDGEGYDDIITVPEDSAVDVREGRVVGFVDVLSAGAQVTLGTQMKARFDYDFSIGYHEITCGEFNRVVEAAGLKLTLECEIADMPASNLTFYDAVLFANAKSVASQRDSAYTYDAAFFDKSGHCISMEKFAFRPESEGFRLPTEAEWTLVAKQGWNTMFSWHAGNSDFRKHEICSLPANKAYVCDMAGNVMEWVNDWMVAFRDTVVENYVGASVGNAIGERVVKGGSYRNDAAVINTESRGDVYTVTSSTHADYIGFRLAYGKIPDAAWLDQPGESVASPVSLLTDAQTIRASLGTSKSKLVFRNEVSGNLGYIDFSEPMPVARELKASVDAYHPDVSPDGRLVAFSTKMEGLTGKSAVYVRTLNSYDTNLIKLDVESATIPRWRVLDNGDTVIVYVTDSGNNEDESVFMAKSTWLVPFMGKKFGTPQKLFDGGYHGGVDMESKFAVTGSIKLRARVPDGETFRDTVWYDSNQACNVSLANDGSKRTAFLDFGGAPGREFAKEKYGVHERILIADSTGKLVHSVKAPAGFSFDHVEWAIHSASGDVLVATLSNTDGFHKKIVLVNLDDDSVMDIAAGEELWHPILWSKQSRENSGGASLNLDSAGVYFAEVGSEAEVFYRYKLELLWSYCGVARVVALGSSRMLNGFNPLLMGESHPSVNLATVPNTMYTSMFLAENYVLPHVENLKFLLVSLDMDLWYKNDSGDNFFYEDYRRFPGFVYDENHGFWKDGVPDGMADAVVDAPGNDYYKMVLTTEKGFYANESGNWGDGDLVNFDSTWLDSYKQEFENAFDHLVRIIEMAGEKDVTVVGIVFPQSPDFRKTGSFGRYGIRRSEMGAIMERLEGLQKKFGNFVLLDENKMGQHDYPAAMASNQDHLNRKGAAQLTHRLDSLLTGME